MDKIQIVAIAAVVLFITLIVRFIIKGKLRTEYSIVWILMGLTLLVFALWRESLDLLAGFFGVYYAPSLVFMFFFFMIFVFLIHLSVVNSKQHEQIKKLAQEMAILKDKVENKSA
ncbi:MAG: DUF2304 domain-containing protein [Sphingobacteriaceae bacterium]|nr:DUF2304 domain-containing protein [Sphingobacteriaceae bacterium]